MIHKAEYHPGTYSCDGGCVQIGTLNSLVIMWTIAISTFTVEKNKLNILNK